MFHRLLYPWSNPNTASPQTPSPAWQPKYFEGLGVQLPDDIRDLVNQIQWHWMFDFSCALARQLRRVGVRVPGGMQPEGAVFVAADQGPVSLHASAHAYIISVAQRAALEIDQLIHEFEPQPDHAAAGSVAEISGLAFFAECASHRGAGRRLSETLQRVAAEVTQICSDDCLPAEIRPRLQFMFGTPVQAKSPLAGQASLPVAGYRIRFTHCDTDRILQALGDAVQTLPPAHRVNTKSDILVLSNLWTPAAV